MNPRQIEILDEAWKQLGSINNFKIKKKLVSYVHVRLKVS
jgi:hypothetical protein